jgi:uncharacterized protein YdeI (YjbR/CyaY-like superfamily)
VTTIDPSTSSYLPPMNQAVDEYLRIGCGRCPRSGTPACSVNRWRDILQEMRRIMIDTGLTEERKWGVPCYTVDGKNVILIGSFLEHVVISFLKGGLLSDPHNILQKSGPNSHVGRIIRFTELETLLEMEPIIREYVREAVDVERKGLSLEREAVPESVPDELMRMFEDDPSFEAAFYRLTPGRQRGYLIHFGQAKQSETRIRRIENHINRIFEGIGIHDR